MMWGFGGFGFLWMTLFWVGVILLIVWAVRSNQNPGRSSQALDILEERFARGEVDVDEFETRRRQLTR